MTDRRREGLRKPPTTNSRWVRLRRISLKADGCSTRWRNTAMATPEATTNPPSRRRWYQFSLRSLIGFVTVCAVGLGWFGWKLTKARSQGQAVGVFETLGAVVYCDYQFDDSGKPIPRAKAPGPQWSHALLSKHFFCTVKLIAFQSFPSDEKKGFNLKGSASIPVFEDLGGSVVVRNDAWRVNDEHLVHLTRLTDLEYLGLHRADITDKGLVHLEDLRQLKGLNLTGTGITGKGLAHVKKLTELRLLGLAGTHIDDNGLVHLADMEDLERLYLSTGKITDAGLMHLKGLSNLKELELAFGEVTDAGLVYLKGLAKLEWLNLRSTQVTDAGLSHLKELTNLKWLDLGDTRVTDAGLVHLERLANLEELTLYGTHVTDEGVKELQEAFPNCKTNH